MDLADRWPLDRGHDARDTLLAAYGDPGRGYHDLRHLAEVLDRLDELEAAGEPFAGRAVRLAAWFHDAVYDGRPAAEERSAELAEELLAPLGVDRDERADVARLVRLTERHRPGPQDRDGAALSDADLAILAAPAGRYAEYVADVRREYAHVPDDAFAEGRAAVLRDLLAKDSLFHTGHARRHWERPARANLARELEEGG